MKTHIHTYLVSALALAAGLLLAPVASLRAYDTVPPQTAPSHAAFSAQSPWLFGDWGGERTRLFEKGVSFDVHYTADLQRNVQGGADVGNEFWGRLRVAADLNLEKIASIPGARIYISGLTQSGGNIDALTGAYTSVSSIVGADTTRLDQFFYEQTLIDGNLMFRVGQIAGLDDFGMITYGDYFLNLELGYSPKLEFATNIPFNAGGQLGALFRLGQAARGLYAKAGIFSGTPGTFDADAHGVDFKWNDTVVAAEIGYVWADPDRPAAVRLGGHYNTDGVFNKWDGSGDAGDNEVFYASFSKTLWQERRDQGGVRGFDLAITAYTAPEDRNMAQYQGLISAIFRAPFASRPNDAVSLGVIFSRMSDDYARSVGIDRGTEQVYELSYRLKVSKWFLVQPDLQYISNPMGNSNVDDAWVAGVRLQMVF